MNCLKKIRIIHDLPGSPSFNMAADDALFQALIQRRANPALRFYSWATPTLSVGYFQNAQKDIDLDEIRERGFGFVRRPTGGRAVFHHREITFCLTIPTGGLGLWDIFKKTHHAIGHGLQKLGIPALVLPAEKKSDGIRNPACFASPSRYELTLNRRKIAGTAQKQVKDRILIHGSIPVISGFETLFSLLRFDNEESRRNSLRKSMEKMTSIHDETGRIFPESSLTDAIIEGFVDEWGVEAEQGRYSSFEIELIDRLQKEKYDNPQWLLGK